MIENLLKQKEKIMQILKFSLTNFKYKFFLNEYPIQIVKSGIEKFENYKEYIDTSAVEGLNNISDGINISYNNRPSRANMQPMPNSVWFAKMKDSNKVFVITNNDKDIIQNNIFSTGFQCIIPNKKFPLSLLLSIILSDDFIQQKNLHSTGTTMSGINNNSLLNLLVPKLEEEDIIEYNCKYSIYVDRLSLIRRKLNILKKTKQNLLSEYF